MKVTKRQLKNIIREEIESALSEQAAGPDMAEVEELAATFEQSPVIMAAIEQAMQDPKVQDGLQKASTMQEASNMRVDPSAEPVDTGLYRDKYSSAYEKRGDRAHLGKVALGGGAVSVGAVGTVAPAFLMAFAPYLAVSPAMVALGITAGPALMAIGAIIANKFGEVESKNRSKAADPSKRSPSDFTYWDHEKIKNS